MKQCEKCELAISCYVDGELGPVERTKLFGHLSQCEACTGFLEHAIHIRVETAKATRYQFSEPNTEEVFLEKRLVAQMSARQRLLDLIRHRLSIPVPVAGAIALFLIVGTLFLSSFVLQSQEPQSVFITTLPGIEVEARNP